MSPPAARQYRPLDHKNDQRAAAQLEAAKAMTFDQCRDAYIESHKAAWKNAKRLAMVQHSRDLRHTKVRCAARAGGRYGAGNEGARSHLEDETRNGIALARPDRGDTGLGRRARLPARRESGALERPSRPAVARPHQGARGRTPRGDALCRDRRVHGRSARARSNCRPCVGILDPQCFPHIRGLDAQWSEIDSLIGSGPSRPSG